MSFSSRRAYFTLTYIKLIKTSIEILDSNLQILSVISNYKQVRAVLLATGSRGNIVPGSSVLN